MITHYDLSQAGPNAPNPGAIGTKVADMLDQFAQIAVYLTTRGATGGITRVTLQVSHDGVKWWDWYRSADVLAAAAASTVKVTNVSVHATAPISAVAIGTGTASAATPLLAKGTVVPGLWGKRMRAVFEADAGVSAGAIQDIVVVGTRP